MSIVDHDMQRHRCLDGELVRLNSGSVTGLEENPCYGYKLSGFGRYGDEEMISLGCFKDHKLNGFGKVIHLDGTVDEGNFKNHKLNGKGKIVHPCGTVEHGVFLNRRLVD